MASQSGLNSQIKQFNRRLEMLHDRIDTLYPPQGLSAEEPLLWVELEIALEELQVAQEELQQQNEELTLARQIAETESARYGELFELAPDGYLVTDMHGIIREVNQAAADLFNVSNRFTLIGKPLIVFVATDYHNNFRNRLDTIHKERTKLTWDVQIVPRRGAQVDVSFSTAVSHDSREGGDVLRWQIHNITERKRAEQALASLNQTLEQRVEERTRQLNGALRSAQEARVEADRANRSRLQFTAIIAHELRTPLTSILGFANTLLAEDVQWSEAEQHNFVEIIEDEARNLQELINQLLDLARLDSGSFPIEKKPTALQDVLASVVAERAVIAPSHELVINVPPDLPLVLIDDRRIEQVLSNLIDNAAKYSPAHTTITVSAFAEDTALRVEVTDEGLGIPPEERDKVFAPFHRINHTGSSNMGGAGLGLAICKGVVEAHGGRISIQDHPGPGTTFSFTLPRADAG
ncbi:MAG: PAS domain-containing sensor histidine kinase [Aggregatilineales bacterium]